MKHYSWKDSGLSIPCLREKAEACKAKTLIRMLTNKNPSIKILAKKMLENECILKRIEINDDKRTQSFLNWAKDSPHERKGTNSLANRARKALNYLGLNLKEINKHSESRIEDAEIAEEAEVVSENFNQEFQYSLTDSEFNKVITFNNSKKISLFITSGRRERWKSKSNQQSFHLHSLYAFHDNPFSNHYVIRQKFPINDKFFRFAIRCRANLLGTPEFDELIKGAYLAEQIMVCITLRAWHISLTVIFIIIKYILIDTTKYKKFW